MEDKKLVKDAQFLVIDFETITPKGVSPEPIEIGVVRIRENQIDRSSAISWLIKPPEGMHLTSFDIAQTGITEKDLIGKQSIDDVMRKLNNSCKNTPYIFIAQNAKYEANILAHHTDKYEYIAKAPVIDTILLAKHVCPNLQNYKLDTIAEHLGETIPSNRHRALADSALTARVFLKLLQKGKIEELEELLRIAKIETPYNKPKQLDMLDFFDIT